ncbi:hypothetical protein [Gemmatimonas sp.]|jgi:hypothetical protein|uniref:hypothetical protein n=1 Tax=Gemmatimonas sp. TaxID=1962908 RepID=UPI0037C16146
MADRKSFLLRVDRELLDAVQRWANDDLRSLNGQVEFLLRRALREAGRAPKGRSDAHASEAPGPDDPSTSLTNDAP